MKTYNIIGFFLVFLLASCNNPSEKRNEEIKTQQLKTQDSVLYEQAIALFKNQEWNDALEMFQNTRKNKYYRKNSLWYIEKIKNRPWQESYGEITESVKGKFSNSATKDSPLWVEIKINNKGLVYLYLYEYSSSLPSNRSAEKPMYDFSIYVSIYKDEYLCYKIRPNDNFEVGDATHSEGIRLGGELAKKIITTLKKSNEKIYFSITMGSSSTYNFYLNPNGFTKAYNSL